MGSFKLPLFLAKHWLKIVIGLVVLIAAKPIIASIQNIFNGFSSASKKITDQTTNILDTLGIGNSSGEEAFKKLSAAQNGYWSPAYAKNAPSGAKLLTYNSKETFTKMIYDSWGFFNKDFDTTIGVLKQLSTKSQVSDLADHFFKKYKKDLLSYIRPANWTFDFRNYPSSQQFKIITDFTDNLKSY